MRKRPIAVNCIRPAGAGSGVTVTGVRSRRDAKQLPHGGACCHMVNFLWCVGSVIFGIAGIIGLVDMAWNRWGF
jgi:hypothetical protein